MGIRIVKGIAVAWPRSAIEEKQKELSWLK
jgi:hypothetical protein